MELTKKELDAMRGDIVLQMKYDYISNIDIINDYVYDKNDKKRYLKVMDAMNNLSEEKARKLTDMLYFYAFDTLPISVEELSDMEILKLHTVLELTPFALKEGNVTLTDILVMSLDTIRGVGKAR